MSTYLRRRNSSPRVTFGHLQPLPRRSDLHKHKRRKPRLNGRELRANGLMHRPALRQSKAFEIDYPLFHSLSGDETHRLNVCFQESRFDSLLSEIDGQVSGVPTS